MIVRVPLGQRQQTNFEREMAKAGHAIIRGREYPALQLRTVKYWRANSLILHPCWAVSRNLNNSLSFDSFVKPLNTNSVS